MHHKNQTQIIGKKTRQAGVALVVSMVLLLATTVLGVVGAQKALLSQKMANNHKRQTKAFMGSEAGISKAIQVANQYKVRKSVAAQNGTTNTTFSQQIAPYTSKQTIGTHGNSSQYYISHAHGPKGKVLPYWNKSKRLLQFASHGISRNGANRDLQVQITYHTSTKVPSSPFSSAIIGRKGVNIKNGSTINAYNSKYGRYGTTVKQNGKKFQNNSTKTKKLRGQIVRNCKSGKLTKLASGAPVYGNVYSKGGTQVTKGTRVYGSVHANGKARINGNVYQNVTAGGRVPISTSGVVHGKVLSGSTVTDDQTVKGQIQSHGGITFGKKATIPSGPITARQAVSVSQSFKNGQPVIKSGGNIAYPNSFKHVSPSPTANYYPNESSSQLNLPSVPTVSSNQVGCKKAQSYGAYHQMFVHARKAAHSKLTQWLKKHQCKKGSCYLAGSQKTKLSDVKKTGQLTIGQKGHYTPLKTNNNVVMGQKLNQLNIVGHVTLLIKGNVNINHKTVINVGKNASLKLLVKGTTTVSSGSRVKVHGPFVRKNSVGQKVPGFAIYSRYSKSGGVTLNENNSSRIAVYAPKTNVSMSGNGNLYGGVAAQKVTHSGSGKIHYDENLKNISLVHGTNSRHSASNLIGVIKSWQQR